MPGPPPTPTHLRLLRGNPSKRPVPKHEPQPSVSDEVPPPPAYLDGYAMDEWWALAPQLHCTRLLTAIDVNALAVYCTAVATWRHANEALARMRDNDPVTFGLLIRSAEGNARVNPLAKVASAAAHDMLRYAAEFGMTPAARARLAAGGFEAQPEGGGKFRGLLA